jgi:hypothetical protein
VDLIVVDVAVYTVEDLVADTVLDIAVGNAAVARNSYLQ